MKKLLLMAGLLAAVGALTVSFARTADDSGGKGEKKKKQTEKSEDWKKYDKNGNGKLDPDEEAAMKADQEKAKSERKKKSKEEGK
jgi:hypothetical protein